MLEQIQPIIMDGYKPNKYLLAWLEAHFAARWKRASEIVNHSHTDALAVARNNICYWFLDHTKYNYLLMLDTDMIPTLDTQPILTHKAEIVACEYIQKRGVIGHSEPDEVACGCLRISRRALELIKPPWFKSVMSPSGMTCICECAYFSAKAKEANLHPTTKGTIEHIIPAVATIQEDGTCALQPLDAYGLLAIQQLPPKNNPVRSLSGSAGDTI